MKRIYSEEDDDITILTDEDEIKDFIEEVERNLENADFQVEF